MTRKSFFKKWDESGLFLFSSFPDDTSQILIGKCKDGVLGTQTRGGRMEGADESTELWRHPNMTRKWLIIPTTLES